MKNKYSIHSIHTFILIGIMSIYSGCDNNPNHKDTWVDMAKQSIELKRIQDSADNVLRIKEKIVSIKVTKEKVDKIIAYSNIPAKNCVGNNMIRLNETLSRSTTSEYSIVGSAGIEQGLPNMLSAALTLELGYTSGITLQRSFLFEVDVQPHTNSEYNIVWKEIWQEGEAVIINSKGEKQKILFEVKSDIRYEIQSVKILKCE